MSDFNTDIQKEGCVSKDLKKHCRSDKKLSKQMVIKNYLLILFKYCAFFFRFFT